MKHGYKIILLFLVGIMQFWGLGVGQAQDLTYSGSLQYSTGSYFFTERTGSLYFSNGLGISADKMSIYFSLPLIVQNTPWISYSKTALGPLPTGGTQNRLVDMRRGQQNGGQGQRRHTINPGVADTVSFSKTHIGDPSLSANVQLWSSQSGQSNINSNWSAKFPLADENSGFGTGSWDFGGGLSWTQRFRQHYLLIVSGMYWYLGDMEDLDLNNILSYSASMGRVFRDGKWLPTISFMGSTEIIDDVDPPVSIGFGLNYQVTAATNLNMNLFFGMTESASDFSIGVGWNVSL